MWPCLTEYYQPTTLLVWCTSKLHSWPAFLHSQGSTELCDSKKASSVATINWHHINQTNKLYTDDKNWKDDVDMPNASKSKLCFYNDLKMFSLPYLPVHPISWCFYSKWWIFAHLHVNIYHLLHCWKMTLTMSVCLSLPAGDLLG